MQTLLYKYLAQVNTVSIEGLGTFSIINHKPAYQSIASSYTAPQQQLVFNGEHCITSEGFIDYVAQQRNTTYTYAKEYIANEVIIMQEIMGKNGFDEWKGIGVFKKNLENSISLVPDDIPIYGQPITAERVIRKEAIHAITVGEKESTNIEMEAYYNTAPTHSKQNWWITALVIGIATIAYLVYYYFTHYHF
jgi:hypothetical protein